jgi:8-oxo-dGTP pyrophosphatase MutT (NUDIX family)
LHRGRVPARPVHDHGVAIPEPRRRVAVAVTRPGPRGPELLVFDQRDEPQAGTQLPGGGIEPGEPAEDAAVREVAEETGIAGVVVHRRLGEHTPVMPDGSLQHTVVVHATTTDGSEEGWEHVVGGHGDDRGFVYLCRFVPLVDALRDLVEPEDAFLPELAADLDRDTDASH